MTLYAERLLPHNTDAEEALIGSLLIDGECIARIAPLLRPGDFYRERNQLCYDAATALSHRNRAIDQTTLAGELARTEKLDLIGGMAYLSHLVSITPTSVHAEDYAGIVSRTAAMRKLISAGAKIAELGYSDTDDLDATLRQAEDALYSVRNTTQQRDFQSFRDIFDRYLQEQQSSMYDLLTGTSAPVMSGFTDLDEVLGGFQRSDLVILAARPSVGKSTLGLNMAMANAKAGQTCAIFSLEMTADQLAMRALAAETGIDSHRIRLRLYTQSQEELMINAIGELSELPIYIDDTPYQGMVEIRGKARRLDLDRGVDLIMVDYLQLVQGQHRGGPVNRVNEITEISRSLKVMAGELNAAVIACSQMSRMVENRPSHRPQLSESELPIYIDDTPYQGMVEIRGKARRLDLDRGVDLIMVDYLQLVQGQHRGGPVNRVNEITEISRSLKVMAGELNAAVIACSQMSRMVENRPSHRPQLSDLRDSGSIEQDADIVAFIHREDLYTTEDEWSQTHPGQEYPRNIAEIIVAKNRKGPTGSVRLEFRDHLVRFDSMNRVYAA